MVRLLLRCWSAAVPAQIDHLGGWLPTPVIGRKRRPCRQIDQGARSPRRQPGDYLRYPADEMAKASRVLAALKRDGWVETRRRGSHRVLVKGDLQRVWAYHDGVDLGGPALARVAKQFGYTVERLRGL